MLSTLRRCFCCGGCASCKTEDLPASFSGCWSHFSSWITMGLRSNQTENNRGGRFRLLRIFGGQRGQDAVTSVPSATDGRRSSQEEEPQRVIATFEELLNTKCFHEASQLLIEREERLFGEITEAKSLKDDNDEVDKLAADYADLETSVLHTLRLSLTPGEVSTQALASAANAIKQEMHQDQRWKERDRTPPAWRPKGWKKVHDETLRSLVEERMDNPVTPPAVQVDQSSLQADVNSMGRQLKADLLLVVEVVKNCYPPELDICNLYARLYHQYLSARLRKIADFVLDEKDSSYLLRWVNVYYYTEILQKPQLVNEINKEALGKLLPDELLEPLEEQYLSKQQEELTTYIGRVLEDAKEKWIKGEEPSREDGCFVSPVAYDIIQLINGRVTDAEKLVRDRSKAQNITCQLKGLMERFKTFQNDIIRQNRSNSRPFIKANLGCIEQFTDVLLNRSQLFPKEVQEHCLLILRDMKQSAHMYLLKPVHETLKPQYRKLGTNEWLKKHIFDKLLESIKQELQELHGSVKSCHEELIGQLHQEVTAEYVKRLLKGEVKLRNKEQQEEACDMIIDNAESLHELFTNTGSKEERLRKILTMIAEVLKLQDLPAIQMQVVSLGTAFPDLSEKHVSALLKLKTNFTKADRKTVKETLSETLKVNVNCVAVRPFFSTVQVK
ncbi:tumor necrosis factor alpha-induced protein 2-like isoform X2 [Morone saxatilis]|uniref:tumor necrosis factor alpha-induced protein 2-like isoform X2 n=1 Tax=Morone saxatilis TaxID=34816 RepID=UPI0015E22CB5|nr:tumor necrosis factor alpha-induced protein 2-like isoform X2 [Morone saxatilis]